MTIKFCLMISLLIGGSSLAHAIGSPPPGGTIDMNFETFMAEVAGGNLDYAAQRYNVPIAEAQLRISKLLLPNPQVQFGYARDVTNGRPADQRESDVRNVSLTQTLQLSGKRQARIDVSRHNYLSASASLDDFLRNLRASAANAFVDAYIKKMLYDRKKQSAISFAQLVLQNEHRFHAGDMSEADYVQSKVDARQFQSDTLSAQADAEASVISLSQFLGPKYATVTVTPITRLEASLKEYKLDELLAEAMLRRPDVISARELHDAAAAATRLAKLNRIPDLGVGLTYSRTGSSSNTVAPYEKTANFGPTVSIELPIFTRYNHELIISRYQRDQTEKQLESSILRAQVEVRQAFKAYQLNSRRLIEFQGEAAIKEAEFVLHSKRSTYDRGNSSLLDLMEAQRALNSVYQAYYDTLSDYAKARVALQQATNLADFGL